MPGDLSASQHSRPVQDNAPDSAPLFSSHRHHFGGGIVGTLAVGAMALASSSCSAPRQYLFVDRGAGIVSSEPGCNECLESLMQVEQKLQRLEDLRAEAMVVFWPVVALDRNLKQKYTTAIDCHRALCEKACNYRLALMEQGEGPSAGTITEVRDWAEKTSHDLDCIFELIDYVKEHNGRWKTAWKAPEGYEFIAPINRD